MRGYAVVPEPSRGRRLESREQGRIWRTSRWRENRGSLERGLSGGLAMSKWVVGVVLVGVLVTGMEMMDDREESQ